MSEKVGSDIKRLSKFIEVDVIQIQSRSLSDPHPSEIDFKNDMAWIWTVQTGLLLKTCLYRNFMFEPFMCCIRICTSLTCKMCILRTNFFEKTYQVIFSKWNLSTMFGYSTRSNRNEGSLIYHTEHFGSKVIFGPALFRKCGREISDKEMVVSNT